MPDFVKISDKHEYKIFDFSHTKLSLLIGGKGESVGAVVVPNLNISCKAHTEKEFYYVNFNRKQGIGAQETFNDGTLSIKSEECGDAWRLDDDITYWDITYDEDPRKDSKGDYVEEFNISCSPGISFYYQPTLEQQYANDPDGCKSLEEFLSTHRAGPKAEGSYHVYCDRQNNSSNGPKFFDGMLFAIGRPDVFDKKGKTEKCDQIIEDGVLKITIPASFLDTASYPITLDPEFGNHTDYASLATLEDNIRGSIATCTENGTGNHIGVRLEGWGATEKVKCVIYDQNDAANDDMVTNGETEERTTGGTTGDWFTFDFVAAPSLSARDYVLDVWAESVMNCYYSGTTNYRHYHSKSYGAWDDPFGGTTGDSAYKYSIYCDYTAANGAVAPTGVFYGPLVGPFGGPI